MIYRFLIRFADGKQMKGTTTLTRKEFENHMSLMPDVIGWEHFTIGATDPYLPADSGENY